MLISQKFHEVHVLPLFSALHTIYLQTFTLHACNNILILILILLPLLYYLKYNF